ncbi:hypothetical protein TRFO_25034 [Tritrichomonas foetus]|uniref:DUF3447 domain-containing protein n=1 Tax=Tritrichomonas foetus TaxID=1144522 RepID=A0A1J4K6P7_9EUKA|nr:hypothetical protein TRFO_25034 [Tritrichomonas foetus]|eukprot:OHT06859.1 hypothetical protein TRFO_25034 [Tritrichomonas foetus]
MSYDELKIHLKQLSEINSELLDYLNNEKGGDEELFEKIINTAKDMNLVSNFHLYTTVLSLITNLSISRPSNKSIIDKIVQILVEFVHHFEMLTVFNNVQLFELFQVNKSLILRLLNLNYLNVSYFKPYMPNVDYLFFLYPELLHCGISKSFPKYNQNIQSDIYQYSKIYAEQAYPENNPNIVAFDDKQSLIDNFYRFRILGHGFNMLQLSIENDDLNKFIELTNITNKFNYREKFTYSLFESDKNIKSVDVIQYALAFGSLNIFKYLVMNKVEIIKDDLKYAIIGGNRDIINIIENDVKILFDDMKYFQIAIKYHQNVLFNYFINNYEHLQLNIMILFNLCVKYNNYVLLYTLIEDNSINLDEYFSKYDVISKLHYSSSIFILFYFLFCIKKDSDYMELLSFIDLS